MLAIALLVFMIVVAMATLAMGLETTSHLAFVKRERERHVSRPPSHVAPEHERLFKEWQQDKLPFNR